MLIVKNTRKYPLYLNLPGGKSLKIRARDIAQVEEADFQCPAMVFHKNRGNIFVLRRHKSQAESAGDTPIEESQAQSADENQSEELQTQPTDEIQSEESQTHPTW